MCVDKLKGETDGGADQPVGIPDHARNDYGDDWTPPPETNEPEGWRGGRKDPNLGYVSAPPPAPAIPTLGLSPPVSPIGAFALNEVPRIGVPKLKRPGYPQI